MCATENVTATSPHNTTGVDLGGAKIMVVEDTKPMRKLLVRTLVQSNATVFEAENGEEAVRLLKEHDTPEHPFSLVLMDIMMPVMDGITALGHIRNDPGLEDVPVVMVSATDQREQVVACARLKVQGFLKKPIQVKTFAEKVRDIIKDAPSRGGGEDGGEPKKRLDCKFETDMENGITMLYVSGILDENVRSEFKAAINELLGKPEDRIAIDIAHHVRITSNLYVGTLIDAGERARDAGKELTVIMQQTLANFCKQKGIGDAFHISVVR